MSGCGEEHCITCGDVALEMTVIALDGDGTLALCETSAGERETVDVTLLAPVALSDRMLVHAGTAIAAVGGIAA
jgi:hydrogenase maturation factor